jgi:4-diphosphocytidyl-2-C-methyl-D-erythritol kinase
MAALRMQALAKVNLGLYILYRRPDNFHELRTVFQTISLADSIELDYRRSGEIAVDLTCDQPDLAGPDNLASRAAVKLLEVVGTGGRVRLHLKKNIPVGAGLGGGSSDAAAVLLALASRLRPRPQPQVLLRTARELGSDVPFFLIGGRALGIGRGAEIYPLADIPARWLVVAAPALPISTAEAYRAWSPALTSSSWEDKIDRFCSTVCADERRLAGRGGPRGFPVSLENDFESVVFQRYPELQKLKARLERLGARPALLCGSGSAVFGMFAGRRQALHARDSLDLEDGRCFVVQTVSRAGYRTRWRKWLNGRKAAG